MQTQYATGQWAVIDDVPDAAIGYRAIIEIDDGHPGAIVCNPSPMGEANARLIAAAPDLLNALMALVGEADLGEVDLGDDDRVKLEHARAAIAKATWGQP
jgi:hypothetical protein